VSVHGRNRGRFPRPSRTVPPHVAAAKAVRAQNRVEARRRADDPAGREPPLFRITIGGEIPWSQDRYVLVDLASREVVYGPVDSLDPVARMWESCASVMRAVDAEGVQRHLNAEERAWAVAVKAEHDEEAA
jgi:hypothetical protein